jgi:hypothetical protein
MKGSATFFYSNSFVSSVIFVCSVIFFSLDMAKHIFKPKLKKLENQARASEQELKVEKITQMAEMAYQMLPVWVPIYMPGALQLGGPRLSLTFAILAKGRCFFGPSA